jgi:hypothetical protein
MPSATCYLGNKKEVSLKTTNYYNTFIEIAEDCPEQEAQAPPPKQVKTAANLQFELLYDHPYVYTSDDILFRVHVLRYGISKVQWEEERLRFFAKGQACMRASPLTKRYGWGVHCDKDGKMALIASGTTDYRTMMDNETLQHVKAMRNKR